MDYPVIDNVEEMNEIIEIEANAFVGPLIKREVVLDVGIPDGELFIYGDDTEYMYRISRKYKVYLIRNAVINHRDVVQQPNIINPYGFWKEYYRFRNRMLFISKYSISFKYCVLGKILLVKEVLRNIVATVLKKKYYGFKIIRVECLIKALYDGFCGKAGKTLDPELYLRKIAKVIK